MVSPPDRGSRRIGFPPRRGAGGNRSARPPDGGPRGEPLPDEGLGFSRSPRCRRETMASFPPEVLTRTKQGEVEVRSLIDRGRFVRYRYLHPETGEPMEGGKVKLVLQI